jgi:hypothetical protein
MNQAIDREPKVLGAEVARVLASTAPRAGDIRLLQDQLLARHYLLRLNPDVSSEEVVESFFRCFIVHYLQQRYELRVESLPTCINSSHQAVRRVCAVPNGHRHNAITDDAWAEGWRRLQNERAGVNITVPTHRSPRRADLYVVARNKIVSFEFKYIGARRLRDAALCAAQVRLHAANHALAFLLLYCGGSVDVLNDAVARLNPGLPGNVRVLAVHGPAIAVVKSTPNPALEPTART